MTAPAILPPSSPVQLWDQGFVLGRRLFAPLATLAALSLVATAPVYVVRALRGAPPPSADPFDWGWVLYEFAVGSLVSGAMLLVAGAGYHGRALSPSAALAQAVRRAPALLATGIGSSLAMLLGLALLVLPGLWIAARLFTTTTVVVLEDATTGRAYARSWQLSRGNVMRLLATVGVASLISIGGNWLLNALFRALVHNEALAALLGAVALLPFTPMLIAVFVVAYFDIRARQEGYGLELALAASGASQPGST